MGDPAVTQVSYFRGNDPARWETGLPTFDSVSLGEVWPGIWFDLRAHGRNVEKIFTVKPGADPSRIRMGIAGARSLRVSGAGSLVVETDLGLVTFTPPEAFQERNSARYPVRVVYVVQGQQYGFELDGYDPTVPLVIDPLVQATYLGGSTGGDAPHTLAIHPISGDVYVAGGTTSTDFPSTAGGAQSASGGGVSFFVARLNAALTTLNQASYLGGSGGEEVITLAIHPTTGDVYVAAITRSTDFPGTAGGAQSTYGGGPRDGLVARLNVALTTLTQATYLGGSGDDFALAFAIHPTSGDVYVAGYTVFTDFPSTAGGVQPGKGGGSNGVAFVARLNAALTTLNQATYLGGSGGDESTQALAIHPMSGDIYVAGITHSRNFPGTAGGAQSAYNGLGDGFVARLTADLRPNNPPVCTSAQPTVASLWAPDQSMQPVSIVGITDPNNDPLTLTYPIVTQDEPIKGLFKKDLSPDAAVSGQQILLRAERGDKGDGRVYEVHFTATDIRGGSCNGTVKVRVPHSRKDTAVDSGQLYNSFGP